MKAGSALLCLEYAAIVYAASEGGRPRGVSPECKLIDPLSLNAPPEAIVSLADSSMKSQNSTKIPIASPASPTRLSPSPLAGSTTIIATALMAPTSLELLPAPISRH